MSFKSARKEAGLTQKEAAAALGVHQSAVALWETGKNGPTVAKLRDMAKLYGCTVDELLSEDTK